MCSDEFSLKHALPYWCRCISMLNYSLAKTDKWSVENIGNYETDDQSHEHNSLQSPDDKTKHACTSYTSTTRICPVSTIVWHSWSLIECHHSSDDKSVYNWMVYGKNYLPLEQSMF